MQKTFYWTWTRRAPWPDWTRAQAGLRFRYLRKPASATFWRKPALKTKQPKKALEGLTPLAVRHVGESSLAFVSRAGIRLTPEGKRAQFKDPYNKSGRPKGLFPEASKKNLSKRSDTYLGSERNPYAPNRCTKIVSRTDVRCRQPAVRGCERCRWHGGAAVKEATRRAKFRDYRPQMTILARREIKQAHSEGLFPPDLWRVKTFEAAYHFATRSVHRYNPRFATSTTHERHLFVEDCRLLVLAYAAAWERLTTASDFEPWNVCNQKANALGLDGGLTPDDLVSARTIFGQLFGKKN